MGVTRGTKFAASEERKTLEGGKIAKQNRRAAIKRTENQHREQREERFIAQKTARCRRVPRLRRLCDSIRDKRNERRGTESAENIKRKVVRKIDSSEESGASRKKSGSKAAALQMASFPYFARLNRAPKVTR